MIDLEAAVQEYVREFSDRLGLRPVPQIRLKQNFAPKRSCGDFNIFVRGPPFDGLRPQMKNFAEGLQKASENWPLPIERVGYSNDAAYLELFLKRDQAFASLLRSIDFCSVDGSTSDSEQKNHCGSNIERESGKDPRLLIITHSPDQPGFDLRRSEKLSCYMRTLFAARGFEVVEIKDVYKVGRDSSSTVVDFEKSEYFDEAKQAFDLRRFLEDRSLEAELDANLGAVYLDSPAIGLSRALSSIVKTALEERPDLSADRCLLCHVAPQNKAYVQQQAGILLEIFNSLNDQNQPVKQAFVIHGGTDARTPIEDYLQQIDDYVSSSLRHRRPRGEDLPAVCPELVQTLAETKLTFDLLAARQMARLKISSLCSENDTPEVGNGGGATFDGKGGIFVQYTCARLAVLLANYDRAVAEGRYPSCPAWQDLRLEDVDLNALNLDFDWRLWRVMFRCQTAFESASNLRLPLLSQDDNAPAKSPALFKLILSAHSICEALAAACVQFSTYYSKVRVLVEAQPHLIAPLKARIFLLVSLRSQLHRGLQMLGLHPVQRM